MNPNDIDFRKRKPYDCFIKIYIYNFLKFKLKYLIISAETEKNT
jgi:hypothetical protein